MSTREELIYGNEFFINKPDLAQQIIAFENQGKGFLSNNPEYKISKIYEIGQSQVNIGRIQDYYYFAIKNTNGTIRHQLFEHETACRQFFINLTQLDEKDLAFWLNQIENLN